MKRKAKWTTALLLSLAAVNLSPAAEAPRLDTHGDPLPNGALTRFGTLRWRHGGAVVFTAYTADGKGLITASQDGTARVWDADSGQEIRRLGNPAAPQNMIACAALSPDGEVFVVGGQDGNVTLYSVSTGKLLRQLRPNPVQGTAALLFSGDGKVLFSKGFNHVIHQWDVAEGKELRKFGEQPNGQQRIFYNGGPSSTMSLSADGKTLASGAMEFDNVQVVAVVKLYDVATGKESGTIKGPINGVQSLAFSPDGKLLAWGTGNSSVSIWDMATRKEVRQLTADRPNGFYANALVFAPDGRSLAARNYDQSLIVWEMATGKERLQVGTPSNNYAGFPCNLAFSADGRRIASGIGFNAVRQWDLATGDAVGFHAGHDSPVNAVAVSADGKTIVSRGGDNLVRVWDSATGKETLSFALPITTTHVSFAGDGRIMASGGYDGMLRIWNTQTGKEVAQWKVNAQQNPGFMSLVLSPDGKTVASRGYEPMVRICEVSSGREVRQLVEPPMIVNGQAVFNYYYGGGQMVFSQDGSTLAVLSNNGYAAFEGKGRGRQVSHTIRLWDVATARQLRQFDMTNISVAALAFSPDGRLLATSSHNGTMSLWETASGKERFQFKPTAPIPTSLAYSPDGKFIAGATVQGTQPIVRFWDAGTGKELTSQQGHQSTINALVFAADGKRLLTGSMDTTAMLWDLAAVKPESLSAVELDAERANALWNDLAGTDARKAHDAIRTLSAAPQTAALLRERLQPVPPPDAERIARLITDLDSNLFVVRHRATEELEKLGELAEPDLQRVLADKPTLEIRQRVERLLDKLMSSQAPPAEELRALRALEALEVLGTTEAREAVQIMVKGAPGARVTRHAQVVLERLAKR